MTRQVFERIKLAAFHRWCDAGKPCGRDWEFWFAAERAVMSAIRIEAKGVAYPANDPGPKL